jgi:MFS family permease
VAALLGIGLFVFAEARVSSPLIQLAVFRNPVLSTGFALSMFVSTVLMTTLVVGPFYLSHALGLPPAVVGLLLSIGPLTVVLTNIQAGRIVDRLGAHRMTIVGLIGITVGSFSLSVVPATFGIPGYIIPIAIITISYALFQTSNNTAIMKDVPLDRRGVISGMLNLSRNLGLITGTAAMGALFAFAAGVSDITTARSAAVANGMRITFAVAAVLIVGAIVIAVVGQVLARRNLLAESEPEKGLAPQ